MVSEVGPAHRGRPFVLGYELNLGLLATLLVSFSGAVEIAQLFVPGRHARLSDFIVDALAITVGATTVSGDLSAAQRKFFAHILAFVHGKPVPNRAMSISENRVQGR
jgi:hypothetical protein